MKLNKRVETIEHTENGVRVHLTDGTVEEGDIVIGADGVHSVVRPQMWSYASKHDPNVIPESDKSKLFSEYDTLCGVSHLAGNPEDWGLEIAETNVIYGQGVTKLFFQQQDKQMWAIIFKGKYSQPPKRQKATEEDMEEVAERYSDLALHEKVKFKDLWNTRIRAGLVTLEEGVLSQWHAGRIVLVGDSAHKVSFAQNPTPHRKQHQPTKQSQMTADLGLGANIAVEDAVILSNILHRNLKDNPNHHPTQAELTSMFAEYQEKQYDRVKGFADVSGKATRAHSYDSLLGKLFATRISPLLYEMQFKSLAMAWAKAPKLDYVPVRTIDESAPGWLLAKEEEGISSTKWLLYASVVAAIAGLAVSRFGVPKL